MSYLNNTLALFTREINMMDNKPSWYIVKMPEGHCQILENLPESSSDSEKTWGPFANYEEAIARRVGLIRAGKCQPQ